MAADNLDKCIVSLICLGNDEELCKHVRLDLQRLNSNVLCNIHVLTDTQLSDKDYVNSVKKSNVTFFVVSSTTCDKTWTKHIVEVFNERITTNNYERTARVLCFGMTKLEYPKALLKLPTIRVNVNRKTWLRNVLSFIEQSKYKRVVSILVYSFDM